MPETTYYVPFKKTPEGGIYPAEGITTDPALVRRLLLEGRIEGYLVAQKFVTRSDSGTLASLFGLHFGSLPWTESGNMGIRARNSLHRHFRSYAPERISELNYPTVGDVFEYFWAHFIAGGRKAEGKEFPIRNFGRGLYETACEVFSIVGLRLPLGPGATSLKADLPDLESLVREWSEQQAATPPTVAEEQKATVPTRFSRGVLTTILMAYDRLVLSTEDHGQLVNKLSEETGIDERVVHAFLEHYFETNIDFTGLYPLPYKHYINWKEPP